MIPTTLPDVLLLDITRPRLSGLEVTKRVTALFPSVRILIFSIHNNPDYIIGAVQNGAAGYLPKDSDHDEILRAVRTVAGGEMYYPPSTTTLIIKYLLAA
jgi:DNA-binding NarL/FixJ family response regulator